MTSGNIRKFYVLFWRHPELDWENARTTELYQELIYNESIMIKFRYDLDFRWMNVHRRTESYAQHRDTVEQYRRYKLRREPLCYLELWEANADGRKEEFWSIDSDYRLKTFLKQLSFYLNQE